MKRLELIPVEVRKLRALIFKNCRTSHGIALHTAFSTKEGSLP
jgi:hypothetical protein